MSRAIAVWTAVASLTVAGLAYSAYAQAPVPIPEPPHTLGRFLGIPQTLGHIYDSMANRRGNLPGLERKGRGARLRRIADPAFLHPEAPPLLKTAAQIKMQEDLAPQKIKALKYLGSIGCGCYDKDGEVTAALLEGLKDCTLEVRMAAVEVIGETAGEYCQFCNERSCCKPALAAKLDEIANGQDENGCWLEPSEQVRAAAAQALTQCGPILVGSEPVAPPEVQRGPESRPLTPEGSTLPPPEPMASPRPLPVPEAAAQREEVRSSHRPTARAAVTAPQPARAVEGPRMRPIDETVSQQPSAVPSPGSARLAVATDDSKDLFQLFTPPGIEKTSLTSQHTASARPITADNSQHQAAPLANIRGAASSSAGAVDSRPNVGRGTVDAVDAAKGVVRVRFEHDGQVPVGTPVAIVHETLLGQIKVSGRVDHWSAPHAIVRPFDEYAITRLTRGDQATLYVPQPRSYR